MERGDARFSVVVPTRDRPEVLARALTSVLAQTVSELEVLVVDDGTPGVTDSVRRAVTDPRVRWLAGPHRGVAAARNVGVAAARHDWVAFLDDDNEWRPGHLARLAGLVGPHPALLAGSAASAGPAPVLVATRGEEVGADGALRTQPPPPSPDVLDALARGWAPFTSCVAVRRTAWAAAGGFPEDLDRSEDRALWLRLALDAPDGALRIGPSVTMVRHRDGGPRLTDDLAAIARADARLEARLGPAVQRRAGLAVAMRWHWYARGRAEYRVACAEGGREAALRCVTRQLRDLPRSAGSIVRPLAVVVLGDRWRTRFRHR